MKKNKLLEFIKIFFCYGYIPCLVTIIIFDMVTGNSTDIKRLLVGSFPIGLIIFMPLLCVLEYMIKGYIKEFKVSSAIGKIFLILGMILVVYGVYQRSQLFK